MNATVTYIGPLAEGSVQCTISGRLFPFKNGKAFEIPEDLAVNLATQSPTYWTVPSVVKKLSEAKSAAPVAAVPVSEIPEEKV